MTENKTAETSL